MALIIHLQYILSLCKLMSLKSFDILETYAVSEELASAYVYVHTCMNEGAQVPRFWGQNKML